MNKNIRVIKNDEEKQSSEKKNGEQKHTRDKGN